MRRAFFSLFIASSLFLTVGCGAARDGSFDAAKDAAPHHVVDGVRIGIQQYRQSCFEIVVRYWIKTTVLLVNIS